VGLDFDPTDESRIIVQTSFGAILFDRRARTSRFLFNHILYTSPEDVAPGQWHQVSSDSRGSLIAVSASGLTISGSVDQCSLGQNALEIPPGYTILASQMARGETDHLWILVRSESADGTRLFRFDLPTGVREQVFSVGSEWRPRDLIAEGRTVVMGGGDSAGRFIVRRSLDGGSTWSELPPFLEGSSEAGVPALLALPDGDRVWLMLTREAGRADEIWTSIPSGSWERLFVLEKTEKIAGLVKTASGRVLLAGRAVTGTDVSRTTLYSSEGSIGPFQAVTRDLPRIDCLGEQHGILYACANDILGSSRSVLAESANGGRTWKSLLRITDTMSSELCVDERCQATLDWLARFTDEAPRMDAPGAGCSFVSSRALSPTLLLVLMVLVWFAVYRRRSF
jgi:hypothetical protein